jgi:hypothetical protein
MMNLFSTCALPLRAIEEKKMRQLQTKELSFVSGGRANTNPGNSKLGSKNAGGGPGNSGPGDKNSPDLGGGGVGPR